MTRSSTSSLPPNEQLRAVRLARLSPTGSGRPMSRQDLAELVNAHLAERGVSHAPLDGGYVGKLERGIRRWPQQAYRDAFRTVLGAANDADLGFYVRRKATDEPDLHEEADRSLEDRLAPLAAFVAVLTVLVAVILPAHEFQGR